MSAALTLEQWRDRALEAEARFDAVSEATLGALAGLYVDETALESIAAVLATDGPTITPGQTWEIREGGTWRQAVVLYADVPTERPHIAGARYWRIRSERSSTIRADVLRRRWQLVERPGATS